MSLPHDGCGSTYGCGLPEAVETPDQVPGDPLADELLLSTTVEVRHVVRQGLPAHGAQARDLDPAAVHLLRPLVLLDVGHATENVDLSLLRNGKH